MDITIKTIFILLLEANILFGIDMKEISKNIDKNFASEKQTNHIVDKSKKNNAKKDDFLDILSKEVWSSFDANPPTKIHSQNLDKILKTKKISYIKSTKSYTGVIDYVDNMISREFTNYMTWVIIIQSFVIILFIILYTDLSYKIKKLSLKSYVSQNQTGKQAHTMHHEEDQTHKNRENLRKVFL